MRDRHPYSNKEEFWYHEDQHPGKYSSFGTIRTHIPANYSSFNMRTKIPGKDSHLLPRRPKSLKNTQRVLGKNTCKSAMRCAVAIHDVNRAIAGPKTGPKHAICAVRCASQRTTFAMRCIFIVIYALTAEIHCDVGHDACIIASEMPRCGELRQGLAPSWARMMVKSRKQVPTGQTVPSSCGHLPPVSGKKKDQHKN